MLAAENAGEATTLGAGEANAAILELEAMGVALGDSMLRDGSDCVVCGSEMLDINTFGI